MPCRESRAQTPLTLTAASRPPASQTLLPSTMAVLSILKGQPTLKNIGLLLLYYSSLGAVVWMLNGPERPKHERVGMVALLGSDGRFERQVNLGDEHLEGTVGLQNLPLPFALWLLE